MNILLVEDSTADARLLLTVAKVHSEIKIEWVKNGEDAIDYVFSRPPYADKVRPDLILLDLNLPRRSGHEVLEELRAHPERESFNIIVLTSSENDRDRKRCKEMNATGCFTKPDDLNEYEALIESFFAM